MKTMSPTKLALGALLVAAVGCGGPGAKTPRSQSNLGSAVAKAFREEAVGDTAKAVDLWLDVVASAAKDDGDPKSVPVLMAGLDALVHRTVMGFADIAQTSALADRLPAKERTRLDEKLGKIQSSAEGPFAAHLVATARNALAERRGDAKAAADHRAKSGCVREVTLAGPLAYGNIAAVTQPGAFDKADAPIPAELPGPGPFLPKIVPQKAVSFGCWLPLYAHSNAHGIREVVVDVDVPSAGVIGVGLKTTTAGTLRVGGAVAIDRAYAMGPALTSSFARVEVPSGTVRLVARVGFDQDLQSIQIGAWDGDGKPLAAHAPEIGKKATVTAKRVLPASGGASKNGDDLLVDALGALAARDPRAAESLLHGPASAEKASMETLLTYARAVRLVRDLPSVKSTERARIAYDRVLESTPQSWEAAIEHAVLAGARRGNAEMRLEMLGDLEKTRAKNPTSQPALLDAFEASVAGLEHLYDRATASYARAAKGPLAGSPLLRATERAAFERTGKDLAAFDCDPAQPDDKTSLACHRALVAVGDRAAAEKELERLRALAGSAQLYLSLSSRDALEVGDLPRASKIFDAMNPGDRQLSTLYAVKGKAAVPEMFKLAPVARDAPTVIPGILRDAGDDPLKAFEGVAEKATAEGGDTNLANAATAILAHDERYDVSDSGLVHFTLLDVRRVMGTTDVEANAQANGPMMHGRDSMRVLRRRIFKKDGRILLPERNPNAAQSHADLSQLEAGDAIEAIYEGWGLPGDWGNIGIDTPDLLPERTAVRDARIEMRLPASLKTSLWSHPMLGKAQESTDGGKRVLVWHVKQRPIRRLESGVPKMDRNVMVSVSTTTWADVAKGSLETIASLDAASPEVSAWAKEAAAGKAPSKELVEAVVLESGKTVKEATGVALSDLGMAGARGGQGVTARTMLATHEGTRTWLVVRALRELGVPTDIVVAENEPFSDSASFPPHFGRFMHPLAVAHVPVHGKTEDVWIDADVPGPPLPAGRISPELRGRNALFPDGRIGPLPAVGGAVERDEIDIRLAVDEKGDAKGSLTVLLRGRSAQDIAEALVRIVGQERQRALRGIVLGWVPFATVEKVELSSSEGSWQIAIRAELTAPAYAQVEGQKAGARSWILPGIDPVHYVFPRPYVSTLGSTYAAMGARENALAINHATQYHVRRRVDLPAGAQIVRLPGPFDGKGPLLSAQRKTAVAGASIEEDFTLDVTTGTVPRERYDEFVDKVHRTDDAFRASTRVKPPTP